MKRDQTKEEKNQRGSIWTTLKYVEHVLYVERVFWNLEKIAIKEKHEPMVIDLASETDYSSILALPAGRRAFEIK